jgi:hypothetical protein
LRDEEIEQAKSCAVLGFFPSHRPLLKKDGYQESWLEPFSFTPAFTPNPVGPVARRHRAWEVSGAVDEAQANFYPCLRGTLRA